MNLLEKYQSNPSWKETLPVMPVYRSRRTRYADMDLRNVLQREPELTLDTRMVSSWDAGIHCTGFGEVGIDPITEWWNRPRLGNTIDLPETTEGVCKQIIEIHKEYFRKTWNPNVFHLVLHSGGRDSRIFSWILKYLQDEEGMDLGEFKFMCQGLEAYCFLEGMKEQGWPKDKYEVYNLERLLEPDYYDFWHFEDNLNGFVGPQLFPTRLEGIDMPNTCLVTFSFSAGFHAVPELSLFHFATYYYNHTGCASTIRFKDVLIPTQSYDYVNFHTQLPIKHFKKTVAGDMVRDTMLKQLGNTAPLYHSHTYNFKFSSDTYRRILREFKLSQFYKTFADSKDVKEVKVTEKNVYNWKSKELRTWGLGTVFEGLNLDDIDIHYNPEQFWEYHRTYWASDIRHREIDVESLNWYAETYDLPPKYVKYLEDIPEMIRQAQWKVDNS